MKWVVLKQHGSRYVSCGPIIAETAKQACQDLALGHAQPLHSSTQEPYRAQGRGRYFAIPLDDWQDGAFNFTNVRGAEAIFSGS